MDVTVAAFDVDNTLTVRDCVIPFMRRVAGVHVLLRTIVSQPITVLSFLKNRDRNSLKALFVSSVFTGRSESEVNEMGVLFASHVGNGWMREDVMNRLRWHQAQGHVVILVSASLSPYLEPLGDLLEVDAVLCTELEIYGETFTGKIRGVNCRGAEKVRRIQSWCDSARIPMTSVRYAYGDSSGDSDMLAFVENPHYVRNIELGKVP
jgi:phosphatidylglycerophosphatase C